MNIYSYRGTEHTLIISALMAIQTATSDNHHHTPATAANADMWSDTPGTGQGLMEDAHARRSLIILLVWQA